MISFHDLPANNKTVLCLLLIAFFTALLFLRSIALRENHLHATYSVNSLQLCEGCKSRYEWHTASTLVFVNNWLQEGAWNLRFALFDAPRAIDSQEIDQRMFYPAYPPGSILPIYLLFRLIQASGFIDDFAHKRGKQLLLVIAYNYMLHLLVAMLLCFTVFLLLRHLDFDRFNAAVLACIPAIIQFHNAHSLYWHHTLYTFDQAVLLPYLAFVFLELLRMAHTSRAVKITVLTLQPLLMFYGMLTDWLFLFVALTVYGWRLLRGDIAWPRSLATAGRFIASSVWFFVPAVAALVLWVWQVAYYSDYNLFEAIAKGGDYQVPDYDLTGMLQFRTGIGHQVESYLHYLIRAFYTWLQEGYGVTGVLMLYVTFYIVWRGRNMVTDEVKFNPMVSAIYVLLFVPCLLYNLFFLNHAWQHVFSALKFSFALSVSFVVLPLMIMQIRGKDMRMVVAKMADKIDIYAVTALALAGMVFYVYLQIYDRRPLTNFFEPPDFKFLVLGEYIRENSEYKDVLFSSSMVMNIKPPQAMSMSGKAVYWAYNMDQVHLYVRDIKQDFRIKIFYFHTQKDELEQTVRFLEANNLVVNRTEHEKIGILLYFDGQAFLRWYEQTVPAAERLQEG